MVSEKLIVCLPPWGNHIPPEQACATSKINRCGLEQARSGKRYERIGYILKHPILRHPDPVHLYCVSVMIKSSINACGSGARQLRGCFRSNIDDEFQLVAA